MIRIVMGLLTACLAGVVCSCGAAGRLLGTTDPVKVNVPEVPPQFRPGARGGAGDEITRVTIDDPGDVTPETVHKVRSREEDLVWTDPDNPESGLQEYEQVMTRRASKGPWRASYSEARRSSMREGRPLLMWFTDSEGSPLSLCKWLSAEVFSTEEFGKWAEREVVRLRLDFNVEGESKGPHGTAEDDRIRKLDYLEKLKERYKVLGLPGVLVLSPDGTVISRYRGYNRSYGDFYFSRIKNDVEKARAHHEEWKQGMVRRGYREWTDTHGRSVFAKLLRYDDGEMILVEPDGKRLRAKERNMSAADRAWIAEQKEKR